MTFKWITFLRSWLRTPRGVEQLNVAVTTTNMSTAAVSCMWLCRNERQVGEGTFGRHAADRGLADLGAELEQLAVDAGSAPKRICPAHLADLITDLAVHTGPSQEA